MNLSFFKAFLANHAFVAVHGTMSHIFYLFLCENLGEGAAWINFSGSFQTV